MTRGRMNNRSSTPNAGVNSITRFEPGKFIPLPSLPSWERTFTLGWVAQSDPKVITLGDIFSAEIKALGYSGVLIKKIAVYALPADGKAPTVMLVPGIRNIKPQYRASALVAGGQTSVGVKIPTTYQGPYSNASEVLATVTNADSTTYIRVWTVLLL